MEHIETLFTAQGGRFLTPVKDLINRLGAIKGFVFDWDGVFNSGMKTTNAGSPFAESDSMGLNMLRFGYWLNSQNIPPIAIISGAANETAIEFSKREHLDGVYIDYKNKIDAINDFASTNGINPSEIAVGFDDILDISMVKAAGLRFMVNRSGSPMFSNYVEQEGFCDYLTGNSGDNFAVREICELILGMLGVYNKVIDERIAYNDTFLDYMKQRQLIETNEYRFNN